jgi:hypothetical protein
MQHNKVHVKTLCLQFQVNLKDMSLMLKLSALFSIHICMYAVYGSELWGFHKCADVEKIHLNFCKNIIAVGKKYLQITWFTLS